MSNILILEAYSRLRREVAIMAAGKLKVFEIGHKQMQILYRLSQSSCTMGELIESTLSDKSSASRAVETLVQAGWIKRSDGESDRRVRIVQLTRKGQKIASEVERIRSDIGNQLEKSLSHEERDQLVKLIDKVIAGLPGKGPK
jgi:DNA-binding MarR family transcriptional regulator